MSVPPDLLPLTRHLASLWTPPRRLPLSSWSEENITLSTEYASRAAGLKLFGWQRGIFDAFTDPRVFEIDLLIARQLVKTLFIQCATTYIVSESPGPILLLEPDEEAAKAFSRERLAPMIRDCEILRGKISDSKHDGNQILMKEFPGGSLLLVSARSSSGLRRRSVRYLFADEIDAYPASVGTAENKEGDPLTIATKSMATFGNRRKSIFASTPTTAGVSRIGKAYASSDQRKPWVPCPLPGCGKFQILKFFPDPVAGGGVWFDSGLSHELSPATARYSCIHCHGRWTDLQRKSACEKAEWRADKPFAGRAGFWISQLYSPWISMAEMVDEFLRVKNDRNLYKAFVNTVLAEEWVDVGERPSTETLFARRENYQFGDDAVVPMRGLFLTAAVDVQENPPRLECEVKAWGRGRENWSVDYRVIQAHAANGQALPVTSREVWDKLDAEVLQRVYPHESGASMVIRVMTIDTGSLPQPVYAFATRHLQCAYGPAGLKAIGPRTVVPVKGTATPESAFRLLAGVSKEDAIRKRQGVRIVSIGTVFAKQEIYDSLQYVTPRPDSTATPGLYHFPMYDMVYFTGLCSEVRVVEDDGKVVYEMRGERNEPLDLAVYNRAAAGVFGIDKFNESHWRALESSLGIGPVAAQAQSKPREPTPTPPPTPTLPPQPRPQPDRPLVRSPGLGRFIRRRFI